MGGNTGRKVGRKGGIVAPLSSWEYKFSCCNELQVTAASADIYA